MTIVVLIGMAMGLDRVHLLLSGFIPTSSARFVVYGLLRTAMVCFVAVIALLNMYAYRRLRDQR